LKTNIVADLEKDGVSDEIIAGLPFYMRNFGYLYCLQAGVERVDLNGKKAGVVTEQEQLNAQKQVREEKEELARKNAFAVLRPVSVVQPISNVPLPAVTKQAMAADPQNRPELARLATLLASTNTIMSETGDKALRSALASASLNLLIQEAQKIVTSLEADHA
jgi:sRNA-binding protein